MLPIQINLPWFLQAHAYFFTAFGLYTVFKPFPSRPSTKTTSPRAAPNLAPQLGVASIAIGLAYLCTAYVPVEENTWLYASVPVRIILALILGTKAAIDRNLSSQQRRSLLVLGLYDGLGGIVLGLWIGTFSGKIPRYQS
jgi:hypothetical protein